MRVLSGIQPSGALHLGNYFGMMKPVVDGQNDAENYIFIANYHALTTVAEGDRLRQASLDVALDFLAWCYEKNADWQPLFKLHLDSVQATWDPGERLERTRSAAEVAEMNLHDPTRAIEAWERLWELGGDFMRDEAALMSQVGLEIVVRREFGAFDSVRLVVGRKPSAELYPYDE